MNVFFIVDVLRCDFCDFAGFIHDSLSSKKSFTLLQVFPCWVVGPSVCHNKVM